MPSLGCISAATVCLVGRGAAFGQLTGTAASFIMGAKAAIFRLTALLKLKRDLFPRIRIG